jgi:hypothetical protein
MTEPTKKDLFICATYACDNCPLADPDCGKLTATIRKLIESMPEPGGVVAGPRESGDSLCKADSTPTGGSIPPSGSMTDEEAIDILRGLALLFPDREEEEAALDYLRARLSQKPKVTRERRDKLLNALVALFGFEQYDSPKYTAGKWMEKILDILGLEVEDN